MVENILIMSGDRNVWQCHSIISGMSVYYEEQVVITSIKSGMQYLMYHVPPEKHKNLYKIWSKQTYKSAHAQLAQQNTIEWIKNNGLKHPDCMHSITNFA